MPLWPEVAAELYDIREEAVKSLGAGATVQVVTADPQRIALYLSALVQTVVFSTLSVVTSYQGIAPSGGAGTLPILYSESGSLCQQAWWAKNAGTAGAEVCAIGVYLRRHKEA